MNEPNSPDKPAVDQHQPPYEHARYAHYAPEPWDDQSQSSATPRIWYFFVAFTVAVMLMGGMFLLLGLVCQLDPQSILDAQAQSKMSPKLNGVADVKNAGVVYLALGGMYVLCGAAVFFMPRNQILWSYGIGLMCLAALSLCFAPFSIVMFIYWMLPATRSYFQK